MTLASSYSLGLFFIFLVAVIWSIASIVVQYLYTDQHFDSPFLLTYIGTSLFILLLLSHFCLERMCIVHHRDDNVHVIPWRSDTAYQQVPSSAPSESVSLENVQVDVTEPKQDTATSQQATDSSWSHEQHIRVALKIAPVWFIANWAYNSSLAYTSITSSTVLASTGSLFTFLFAVLCGDESFTCMKLLGVLLGVTGSILTGLHDVTSHDKNETNATTQDYVTDNVVNPSVLCVAGPSGTPHHLNLSQANVFAGHALWGDALGLLSAVGYGTYAVMIRIQCPRDERLFSMQLLLGYIGLLNAVALSPVAFYILLQPSFSANGISVTVGLTWMVFGFLVAKGMLDNVLSDYLWARAVVLTSATVATVGLGLTIPLAFVSDWIMGHDNVVSIQSIAGALAVLAGFILVNISQEREESHGEESWTSDDGRPSPQLVISKSFDDVVTSSSSLSENNSQVVR